MSQCLIRRHSASWSVSGIATRRGIRLTLASHHGTKCFANSINSALGDPSDRIPEETIDSFNEQLADRPDATVRVEMELWSHQSRENQRRANARLEAAVRDSGGELVRRCSIPEIAYEAALVDLPAAEVRCLIERQETLLAICDGIMYVRPQSITLFPTAVTTLGSGLSVDPSPEADTPPIAALFDGIPVQRHRLLEPAPPVGRPGRSRRAQRRRGTATR